jgi:hypothetical protein
MIFFSILTISTPARASHLGVVVASAGVAYGGGQNVHHRLDILAGEEGRMSGKTWENGTLWALTKGPGEVIRCKRIYNF